MIWIQAAITLSATLAIGVIIGIGFTMYLIRKGIREADIASDDKRFIQDLLGIRS